MKELRIFIQQTYAHEKKYLDILPEVPPKKTKYGKVPNNELIDSLEAFLRDIIREDAFRGLLRVRQFFTEGVISEQEMMRFSNDLSDPNEGAEKLGGNHMPMDNDSSRLSAKNSFLKENVFLNPGSKKKTMDELTG
jgi:hypothetical protein